MSTNGLHVVGRNILNEDNEIVILRGANRPGTEYSCVQYQKIFDGPSDVDHIHDIRNWKINALRIPLNEDCWLGLHSTETAYFGASYRQAIIKYINMLTENNIAAILDLHWAGGDGGTKLATHQIPMPNDVNSPEFWKQIASTFKGNSRVLFDLYNEPYPYGNDWDSDQAWQCWKDGVNCGSEITYKVAGMQQLIDAVRSTGSKNIILLSGIQYATSVTKFLQYIPSDPANQLASAIHSYDFNYCRSRGCWDIYLRPVFEKYPIVATETGQKDCQTDFISDFLHYADQNNIHYLAWSWLVAPCDNPSLIVDYEGTPTAYGKGLKNHLATLADGKEPYYTDTFDIYNDKMTHWADDWSSSGLDHILNSTTTTHEGKYSIQYLPKSGKTLHFMCWSCIKTEIHKSVEFWVNGGPSGGQKMQFDFLKVNADKTNRVEATYELSELAGGSIPANKWVKIIVDLTKLPNGTSFDGFWWKPSSDQPNMFVDKITVRAIYEPPPPSLSVRQSSKMSTIQSKDKTKISKQSEPWVSKYRPKTVDEVAHQEEVVTALKKALSTGNLPHLLFYGPPGTGKTSTILAVAMDIYGPELFKDRVLELNASDERGIDVVRTKIKNFANFAVNRTNTNGKGGAESTFKLIILDEADSMTMEAQSALRRTIEATSKTTRFCLLCNYISRIIDPLSSRCAKFRFKPLDNDTMVDRLQFISEQENFKCSPQVFNAIQSVSGGDMRKAITFLQTAYRFYGNNLTPTTIYNISGTIEPNLIEQFVNTCKMNSFEKLQEMVQRFISLGYPASQVINQLFDYFVLENSSQFSDKQLAEITMKIGSVDKKLVDGAEEFLQLFDIASFIMKQLCSMIID
eukprot:gene1156-1466_t